MDYVIDSHFHIWDLKKFQYTWLTENEALINRDILADEYETNIQQTPVKYGIFVQCIPNSLEETLWVLQQNRGFIKGVVAGLSLGDHVKLKKELDELSKFPEFVGCRHFDIDNDDWLADKDILHGIKMLEAYDKTFDFNINQRFVVDHMAKPYIKDKKIDGWKQEMEGIAKFPNAYCKISGMVTEADPCNWKTDDFKPYVKHIIDMFGVDRCMFGSDWPVCTLANASYKQTYETYAAALSDYLAPGDKAKIFKENATRIYKLAL